MNRGLV